MAMPPGPGFPHISPGCLAATDRISDLWCPGDAGYECYKIPSLLRIPGTTTLLGFIEARKHSCDDAGYIDLLLKRSHDNGKTWSEAQMVYGNSTESEWHTIGDALPVYDAVDKSVHLVFTRDNTDAFVTKSTDDGATWATPRNISDVAVKHRGKFLGTGHASGLQMASGRLLVPMYGGGSTSFVLASDDHGASWHIRGQVNCMGNEWVMAPVAQNGSRLYGSIRSMPFRLQSFSDDEGATWTPVQHMFRMPEPISGCEGAVVLHPNGRLFYSHPDEYLLRNVMRIKRSDDGGKTWHDHATIWGPGAGCDKPCVPAASYSSMSVLGDEEDSEIGIFFMRNNVTMLIFEGRGASFATFKPQPADQPLDDDAAQQLDVVV
eukprot:TRINITY_DN91783_c0_g1_i1.p1 TRINITY_DN91783_c0_g1~~TRINITY_DN91783_c0_g1_i1.p1  ORF type:complete len:412 (-),score=48.84 TRINITY_DN91783_c0_g1_i1:108-1238(-)